MITFVVMVSTVSPLESISCFACLDRKSLRKVQDALRLVSYAKGEVVFLEGEKCPGLFIVRAGSVKLYRSSPEGEEHIVRVMGKGGCFECAPLFDHGPNAASAQALGDSELYLIPASVFRELVATDPTAALKFSEILAMRLRSLLSTIEDMSFRPVQSRLARLILQMAEPSGDAGAVSPKQALNQQHLACMLGCSRQVVNMSLNALVKRGIVSKERRRIRVLKAEELRRLADQC